MRLRKNGTRQPQVRNCSPDMWLKPSTARLARKRPHGTPNCGHEVMKPREWLVRAHSIDISTEPPLAADTDALDEAQDGEDHCAPDADALIGRHQRHREGGEAHQQQRRNQCRLAADAVTVVAEDGGADG